MIYSLLDSSKELNNRRAVRREKNELSNIVNGLEKVLDDSLLEDGEMLTDEQWDCIEKAVIIAENRIFILEKALKDKMYK